MSVRIRGFLIVALSLVAVTGCNDSPADYSDGQSSLAGAWLITETTTKTPDSISVNKSPQPGLYLFTDRHFSLMLIPGEKPRAELPEGASLEERCEAFENFVADAGTYEVTDSTLTMHNIIAKNPRAMNGGAGGPYQYKLSGDALTLTFSTGWARGAEITYRLIRLQ